MKKKKKWVGIVIAVAVVAIAVGAIWYFAGETIANRYALSTMSDEEYMEYYVKKLVGRIDTIKKTYMGETEAAEENEQKKLCPEGSADVGIKLNGTELAHANFILADNRAVFGSIPEYREDYVQMGYLLWDDIVEIDGKSTQEKADELLAYVKDIEIDKKINDWMNSKNVRCKIKLTLDLPDDAYVVLYTTLRGDLIGVTLGLDLGEAKLEADINYEIKEVARKKLELELETKISGLKVNMATCKLDLSLEGDVANAKLNIKPGSFLMAFVKGLEKADISIEATAERRKVVIPDTPYDIFEITESDYINLEKAIGFGLKLYDRLDGSLQSFAVSMLGEAIGLDLDIDSIRTMYEAGAFGLSGISEEEEQEKVEDAVNPDIIEEPVKAEEVEAVVKPEEVVPKEEPVTEEPENATQEAVEPENGENEVEAENETETEETEPEDKNKEPEEGEQEVIEEQELVADYGDALIMDITPILYGALIRDMTQKDVYAVLGENSLGDNLDDKMIGVKVGEERDVYAVLGEEYGDFAGYEGTFRVKVKEIRR